MEALTLRQICRINILTIPGCPDKDLGIILFDVQIDAQVGIGHQIMRGARSAYNTTSGRVGHE